MQDNTGVDRDHALCYMNPLAVKGLDEADQNQFLALGLLILLLHHNELDNVENDINLAMIEEQSDAAIKVVIITQNCELVDHWNDFIGFLLASLNVF